MFDAFLLCDFIKRVSSVQEQKNRSLC